MPAAVAPVNRFVLGMITFPAAIASFVAALAWPHTAATARAFWAVDIAVLIAIPCAALALSFRFARLRPHHIGFVPLEQKTTHGSVLAQLLLILCAFVLFTPLTFVLGEILPRNDVSAGATSSYFGAVLQGENRLFWILYFSLTAAVAEEVVFRGMLAAALIGRDASDKAVYVFCSSILFGLAHFARGLDVVVAATVLGVFCALIYLRWRNLWYLIFGHFVAGLMSYG